MEKLKVGIIGAGGYAVGVHAPKLKESGRAEVVAVSRRNQARLGEAQKLLGVEHGYTDWRRLLDHPGLDAVVVATSHNTHTEPTIAALERGMHVLVEKPMALSPQDAWAMVAAAERANRVLLVGFQDRLAGPWRKVKQLLDEGAIGKVRQVSAVQAISGLWFWDHERAPAPFKEAKSTDLIGSWLEQGYWRANPTEMGGGFFVDVASHVTDLMLCLAGGRVTQVSAFVENASLDVDCYVTAQARLDNKVLLSFSWGAGVMGDDTGWFGHGELSVFGDEGILRGQWKEWNAASPMRITLQHNGERTIDSDLADISPVGAFLACVLDGAPNPVSGREGAAEVALTDAVYRSAASGQIVTLPTPPPVHRG